MFRNNAINTNSISKQYVNIEKDVWGKRLYDKLGLSKIPMTSSAHKSFHRSVIGRHLKSRQSTDSLYVTMIAMSLNSIYRKTSFSSPWRSIFQPFPYSGVLLEVTFN